MIDDGLIARFWKKVKKTPGCWEWLGSKDRKGYGRIKETLRNGNLKAHRVSYELHLGPIPTGLWVLHTCDNPSCVCPDHLFLGTNDDNVKDQLAKGRSRKGERNANAHLTPADIKEIHQARARGESCRSIAERLSISRSNVYMILEGHSWKHVAKD